jgi:hypothetical protein
VLVKGGPGVGDKVLLVVIALAAVAGCRTEPERNAVEAATMKPEPEQAPVEPSLSPSLEESVASVDGAGLLPPEAVIGSDSPISEAKQVAFSSPHPLQRVLAWYRSPERRGAFRIDGELREGSEQVLSGTSGGGPFTVRLTRGANGGVVGMVLIDER